ncbi:nickel-responsive transcriptional regulator NikR [Pseudorhodoferax sp. Leaf267]|uniref:nickel-responsive transcriptional regulator NikR n=1 Tax=Pseudorhodoferax sp. Leaf267 TaxID=1736316 RepID=UPI0006FDFC8E|nr:nickel-responsive transcriptional regulator NikR [Pseudorhodoferax sp. Leaf267]KQP13060.1 hypothetical protein ASF43_18240 [Pseudorhodoferax sp. Leaf267]
MQRFTISLDDALAQQFDALIAAKGYENRSEAVRDLIRSRLGDATLSKDVHEISHAPTRVRRPGNFCVASVTYVYDHHDQTVTRRVLDLQQDHLDLAQTSLHTHPDHRDCLETAVLPSCRSLPMCIATRNRMRTKRTVISSR